MVLVNEVLSNIHIVSFVSKVKPVIGVGFFHLRLLTINPGWVIKEDLNNTTEVISL